VLRKFLSTSSKGAKNGGLFMDIVFLFEGVSAIANKLYCFLADMLLKNTFFTIDAEETCD